MKLLHSLPGAAFSIFLVLPAQAGETHNLYGIHGGYISKSHSSNGTTFSRSLNAQGPYNGAISVDGSCTQGAGCSRTWSRTLRNGNVASGVTTVQRGVGVSRTGTGFRGRKW